MNAPPDDSTADDPRLFAAVQEYLHEVEAGRRPNRRSFAARYPELADMLEPYLEALDAVTGLGIADWGLRIKEEEEAVNPQSPIRNPQLGTEPLGDFSIVRQIGRGGMGVVYEAVQLSLGRRVALKVLPFAAALDARQLQRFKNEAQAAAHLHHTNIVPVHAVGCDRGVHYYAMQLIDGENLASLIDTLRREGEGHEPEPLATFATQQQLSTQRSTHRRDYFRTVARLAVQVAEGLDYAHGLGVIHRDIKPANILIDVRGNVWITDFGLAQFHADASLTQTGDLVGTLRYMSPEQAGGQRVLLDHRTDVYALGATLYELLTLRPIFEGTDRQALLRQIMNDEPRPPRAVDPAIPQELETIVLKAVGKSPLDRYTTARDFADDLQRFLRDEPILARRATLVQRGRKWLRRHPSVLVGGTLLLLILAVTSLVGALLLRGEQAKTRLAYEKERQRAEEAEERFQLARRAADDMIQLAEEELADRPYTEALRKRMLETALVYYQLLIKQRRDDPLAQADLAATQARVEKILDDLAVLQGAGQLRLLDQPAVLDDLRASADQRDRIKEVRDQEEERKKQFDEFHRLTPEERQRQFLELARSNETAVNAILTREQLHRLRQIALQFKGPAAFREPEVAAALKLTADQKERIRAIESDLFQPRPEGPRGGAGGAGGGGAPRGTRPGPPRGFGSEEMRKAYEDRFRLTYERLMAVLTEGQKKSWRQLTGEPFKGPLFMYFPRRPFGGGR